MVSAHKWPQGKGYMAISLALIAGYIDAYGFIQFGTFVSFMSGNTTEAGSNVGTGLASAAFPSFIAIVSFVAALDSCTMHAPSPCPSPPKGEGNSWKFCDNCGRGPKSPHFTSIPVMHGTG